MLPRLNGKRCLQIIPPLSKTYFFFYIKKFITGKWMLANAISGFCKGLKLALGVNLGKLDIW